MSNVRERMFVRTDIWREGKWLDLWSVVHLLSGVSIGLGIFFLHFTPLASVLLTLVSLVAYEMWETIVKIEETPANRVMDVVVGMASFLPVYFFLAPALSTATLILVFGIVFTANVVMSVFGWYASQKAAVLEESVREKYATQRAKFVGKKRRLQHTLHS